MGRIVFAAIIIGGLVLSSVCFGYSGGSGTAEEPYQIANKADLLVLAGTTEDYNKCFILTADIDMREKVFTTAVIAPDTNNTNYTFEGTAFTGIFDGNGHKITNLTINDGSNSFLGLFGYISTGGQIKNLGLENCAVGGSYNVGGLAGYNYGGSISNCYSTGIVIGTYDVGGLVGNNYGSISNCYSTGTVSGTTDIGGLVGYNDYGSISDCYSTDSVSGTWYVGGLVGYNDYGSISNCYSTGAVTSGDSSQSLGGLVGNNGQYGSISDCYSTGSVSGSSFVGSLVGSNGGSISDCYSTGSVSGSDYVGGLVGSNGGSISNCYSMGTVSGSHSVGGLVGFNYGSIITNCYSTGTVNGASNVGGLVGYNSNKIITNCYSTGTVNGASNVGGLVGWNDGGDVVSSFWDVNTSGQTTSDGGTGLNTAQMMQQASFTGWDFTTKWAICEGTNYPRLRWQIPAADFTCPDGVDFIDFAIFANAWLSDPTQVNWNGRCDIAEPPDSVIDILDLAIFAQHWLEM